MRNEKNTGILQGLCVVLPTALLAAAHWFPWKRVRQRELHQLEAYAIGTGAIVGTAGFAIALSNGDKNDHVGLLGLATLSAGGITLAAHAIDAFAKSHGEVANLKAQIKALQEHGDL